MQISEILDTLSMEGYSAEIVEDWQPPESFITEHPEWLEVPKPAGPTIRIKNPDDPIHCSRTAFMASNKNQWDVEARTPDMFFRVGSTDKLDQAILWVQDVLAKYSEKDIETIRIYLTNAKFSIDIYKDECYLSMTARRFVTSAHDEVQKNTVWIRCLGRIYFVEVKKDTLRRVSVKCQSSEDVIGKLDQLLGPYLTDTRTIVTTSD